MTITSQSAHIPAGSGNVVVQIVGDGNTVVSGHPHLMLTRFENERRRGGKAGEIARLSPYARSTTLVGREHDLAALQSFLDAPRPVSVRVLVAGGGVGKTRLALDLCDRAVAAGWHAGFATGDELVRFFTQRNPSSWGWQRPTLVVVDYAAVHAQALAGWMSALADREADGALPPLRLLLLERHADTQGGWWRQVFDASGWLSQSVSELLDPPESVTLAPLASDEARLALLRQVMGAAADDAHLSAALRHAPLDVARWLGDPLYLMMAGLHAALHGAAATLALGRTDLARALVPHERKRIASAARARGVGPELALHLAACVTLSQGLSREDFMAFAEAEKAAIGRPAGGDPAALADVLHHALPRTADHGVAAIVPDLIGEAFVLDALRHEPQAPLRCWRRFGAPVAQALVRMAQDFGALEATAGDGALPLQWLDALVRTHADDADFLVMLADLIPHESMVLRDLNVVVTGKLLTLRAGSTAASEQEQAAWAVALGLHAIALRQTGRRDEALVAAQEAVVIRRDLAALRPDAFRPDLASSLNNLGNMLSDLGRRDEALAAAQEAVGAYRDLAALRPDVFRPALATSLNNLGNMLNDLGRRDEALAAAQEAVGAYRDLATLRPDVFRPALATSLSNLGSRLSGLGRHDEALAAAQETVVIRRDLAALRLDVFRPDLASSLSKLGSRLSDLGRCDEALAATQEAVVIRRDLAALRPDVFRPDLASSLNNLGNRLSDLDRRDEALAAVQEAVGIWRDLVALHPDVFRSDFAMSLGALGRIRFTASRLPESHAAFAEGIATLTPSFERHPAAFADLMRALGSDYFRTCEALRQPPDDDLLAPIIAIFRRLSPTEE